MGLIREVVDGVKLVIELVEGIQKIAGTIKSGADFLSRKHPDVRNAVLALCEEIDKTLQALADASALVTRFRFTVAGPAVATEPTRFNDYLVSNQVKESDLAARITQLRGRCAAIDKASSDLSASALRGGLRSLWSLFGQDGSAWEIQMADTLDKLHNEEAGIYQLTGRFAEAIVTTLRSVDQVVAGDPAHVPAADALLREHAAFFFDLEAKCRAGSADFAAAAAKLV